jgi:excisionase family DNA binding protein
MEGEQMNSHRESLLTVPEAAESLRLTRAGVRRWILDARIATIRVGRRVLIPGSEIDRILKEGFRPAKAEVRRA